MELPIIVIIIIIINIIVVVVQHTCTIERVCCFLLSVGNMKIVHKSVTNGSFFEVLFCFPKLKYCATFSDVSNNADKSIKNIEQM